LVLGHHADALDDHSSLDKLSGVRTEDMQLLLVGVQAEEVAVGRQQQDALALQLQLRQLLGA